MAGNKAPITMLSVIKFVVNVAQLTAKPREIKDRIFAGATAFETGNCPLGNRKKILKTKTFITDKPTRLQQRNLQIFANVLESGCQLGGSQNGFIT